MEQFFIENHRRLLFEIDKRIAEEGYEHVFIVHFEPNDFGHLKDRYQTNALQINGEEKVVYTEEHYLKKKAFPEKSKILAALNFRHTDQRRAFRATRDLLGCKSKDSLLYRTLLVGTGGSHGGDALSQFNRLLEKHCGRGLDFAFLADAIEKPLWNALDAFEHDGIGADPLIFNFYQRKEFLKGKKIPEAVNILVNDGHHDLAQTIEYEINLFFEMLVFGEDRRSLDWSKAFSYRQLLFTSSAIKWSPEQELERIFWSAEPIHVAAAARVMKQRGARIDEFSERIRLSSKKILKELTKVLSSYPLRERLSFYLVEAPHFSLSKQIALLELFQFYNRKESQILAQEELFQARLHELYQRRFLSLPQKHSLSRAILAGPIENFQVLEEKDGSLWMRLRTEILWAERRGQRKRKNELRDYFFEYFLEAHSDAVSSLLAVKNFEQLRKKEKREVFSEVITKHSNSDLRLNAWTLWLPMIRPINRQVREAIRKALQTEENQEVRVRIIRYGVKFLSFKEQKEYWHGALSSKNKNFALAAIEALKELGGLDAYLIINDFEAAQLPEDLKPHFESLWHQIRLQRLRSYP